MTNPLEQAIAGNIEALQTALRGALGQADEALAFVRQGDRNAAIGCIADLEVVLAEATALQAAARALHRQLR